MYRSRRRHGVAGVLSGVLLLTAWASGGAAVQATAADDTTAEAPSGDPVQIMLIYDDTGPGAAPELLEGATAGVNVVNAQGGVNGRPVELVPCATANDPNTADDCARQAADEGIVAVVGELTLQKGHQRIDLTERHEEQQRRLQQRDDLLYLPVQGAAACGGSTPTT